MINPNITDEFLDQLIKSRNDITYFIENFVKLPCHQHGTKPFILSKDQRKIISLSNENRFVEENLDRAAGKSVLAAAIIVHSLVFYTDRCHVVMMETASLTEEIRNLILFMIDHLPDFYQTKFSTRNKRCLVTNTNASVYFDGASGTSLRGRTVNFLYVENANRFSKLDRNNLFDGFYPVITSGKAGSMLVLNS